MTEILDIYLHLLLKKKAFAHLAAVRPDGKGSVSAACLFVVIQLEQFPNGGWPPQ